MNINRKLKSLLGVFCLIALAAPQTFAANFTFAGSFTRDDQANLYQFSITAPATVSILTTSYSAGGFSPVLSLFDSQNMNLLVGRDSGLDHANGEASLSLALTTGNYIFALTQYDNLAAGPRLSDGFLRTGDPTFTREFGTGAGPFLNIDGAQRTGNFALGISNVVSATAAPEPSNVALAMLGSVCILFRIKKASK